MYDASTLTETLQTIIEHRNSEEKDKLECLRINENAIKYTWDIIANEEILNNDTQLICLRIAILSLTLVYDAEDEENITQLLVNLIGQKNNFLTLTSINVALKNVDSFRYFMCYGILNILGLLNLTEDTLPKLLWKQLYDNSLKPSKLRLQYYKLLVQSLNKLSPQIDDWDLAPIFHLACNNLEVNHGCCLLQRLFNRYDLTYNKNLFVTLTTEISWAHKYKYAILNELLKAVPQLIYEVDHDDFSDALVYAQTRTFLLSASSKLYITILSTCPQSSMVYYSKYELVLQNASYSSIHQNNIINYYMPSFFKKYPEKLIETIKKFSNLSREFTGVFMQLLLIGIKSRIIKSDDFNIYVDRGLYHKDEFTRLKSFEVLCLQINASKKLYVYSRLKKYLTKNINSITQSSREEIRKSFTIFIKSVQLTLIHLNDSEESIKTMILSFLKWLLQFLILTFVKCTNYQGIALSKILAEIIMQHFTLPCINPKDKNATKIAQLITNNAELKYILERCFTHSVDIILRGDKHATVHRLIHQLSVENTPVKVICAIEKLGKYNICSSNFRNAEMGKELLELVFTYLEAVDVDNCKQEFKIVIDMMFQQWCELKCAEETNAVIQDNPLHPFISLIDSCVRFLDNQQIDIMMNFIEEVVHNLLQVFIQRAMLPHAGSTCVGISKAFEDQTSEEHACTVSCTWLVLKECCKLATTFTKVTKSEQIVSRSVCLLTDVIKGCYHKGALEIAGSLLGEIVCDMTKKNYHTSIIDDYVDNVFLSMPDILEISSTVRRSAETRIILSSIAMNDNRSNKPLYHKTMSVLLEIVSVCLKDSNYSPERLSLMLHCIVPLICNKLEMMQYIDVLLEHCFKSFKISHWNIRNAALQILSSLVPILFGANISNNDEEQQRIMSLEETFSRYPSLGQYISKELGNTDINSVIPLLTLISQSYSRGVYFTDDTVNIQILMIKTKVRQHINRGSNFHLIELAAKAFASLCPFSQTFFEIAGVLCDLKSVECEAKFKAHMLLLKALIDSVLMNPISTYPKQEEIVQVQRNLVDYLNSLNHNEFSFRTCSSSYILAYSDFIPWSFSIPSYKVLLQQACIDGQIAVKVIGVWHYLKACFMHSVTFVDEYEFIDLIQWCLTIQMPIHFRITVLETLEKALGYKRFKVDTLSEGLIDEVFEFMHTEEVAENFILMTLCEDIFLKFNPLCISYCLIQQIIDQIHNATVSDAFIPTYCSLIVHCSPDSLITKFFITCANKCIKCLTNEYKNASILKCTKYLINYGTKTKFSVLRVYCVELLFEMLKNENQVYQNIGCDLVAICMNNAPTYPYMSITNLLNSNFLSIYLGPEVAIKFLISMFTKTPDKNSFAFNPFDDDAIEVISSQDLDELMWCSIHNLLGPMTILEKQKIAMWFRTYAILLENSDKLSIIKHLVRLIQ